MSEVVQALKGGVDIIIGSRCPRQYYNQGKTLENRGGNGCEGSQAR